MCICWYCWWGWPEPVYNIYKKALDKLGGDEFPLTCGPAHIVWEDENFDSAQWCLDHFGEYTDEYTKEQMDIVRQSLLELLELADDIKDIIPDNYDGQHPELYPPPSNIKMVSKHD